MAAGETLVLPGAVDLHVHFREPGSNLSESFESGSIAAMLGGYALYIDMPNTPGRPTYTYERASEKSDLILAKSVIPGGIYAGSQPDSDNIGELASMSSLALGIKFYSDATTGNETTYDASDFREQVQEWHRVAPDKPMMFHAAPDNLEDMIGLVAQDTNHHLHVCHVSNMVQIELIDAAKKKGLPVTSGVTPHHLFLNSQDADRMGWYGHMKPPLEHQTEAEAILGALIDGRIDVVETDHAPHTKASKEKAERENPLVLEGAEHATCYGVPGIEFAIPLLLRQLHLGNLAYDRLREVTSDKPADILGIEISRVTNVTWDMEEYRIEREDKQVQSKAGWTPFLGSLAIGKVKKMSIGGIQRIHNGQRLRGRVPGRFVHERGEVI